jgi:hypothetical protein
MFAVINTVSPEKSTMVTKPGRPGPGLEITTAYFCG